MIRMRARAQTGSDGAFHDVLRTYLQRYRGAKPTTVDFQAVVEEHLEGDWQSFFDQWVGRRGAPELAISDARVNEHDGSYTVTLGLEQQQAAAETPVGESTEQAAEPSAPEEPVKEEARSQEPVGEEAAALEQRAADQAAQQNAPSAVRTEPLPAGGIFTALAIAAASLTFASFFWRFGLSRYSGASA